MAPPARQHHGSMGVVRPCASAWEMGSETTSSVVAVALQRVLMPGAGCTCVQAVPYFADVVSSVRRHSSGWRNTVSAQAAEFCTSGFCVQCWQRTKQLAEYTNRALLRRHAINNICSLGVGTSCSVALLAPPARCKPACMCASFQQCSATTLGTASQLGGLPCPAMYPQRGTPRRFTGLRRRRCCDARSVRRRRRFPAALRARTDCGQSG